MEQRFFSLNDDFEAIIRGNLDRNTIRIQKIPTGWTNYVYMAEAGNGDKYIFRFPRNDFWVERMERELLFSNLVRSQVNVMTPTYRGGRHNGRIFTAHKMIGGHTLTDVMDKLSNKQKQELAKDLAEYMSNVHAITDDDVPAETASDFLRSLAMVNNRNFDLSKLKRLEELDKEKVQTHGDLNTRNILVDDNYKMVAVLDYAFTPQSTPLVDLARIIGGMPCDFYKIMVDAYETKAGKKINLDDLNYLINLWHYVEDDYKDYMLRCHPDVILPKPPKN